MKVKWERFSNINIISRQNNQSNHSSRSSNRSRCLNNGSSQLIFSSSTMLISSIIIIIIIIIRSSRSKYFHNSRIYRQITMEVPPLIYIFIRNRIWNWNSSREGYNWRTTTTSSRSLVEIIIIIIITTTTTTPVDLLSPETAAALFRFRRLPRISMEISVAEMIMTSLLFDSLHWPGHHTFGTPSQNKNENNHTLL